MDTADQLIPDTLLSGLLVWKGGIIVLWLAFFFCAERLWPAAPQPALMAWERQGKWRLGRNFGLWLMNSGLSVGLVLPLTIACAALSMEFFAWRPVWWAGGWGLVFDLLALDFLIYWWHRINHEWRFLWRFHEIHHLDAWLDSTSALRFHFGEVALSALARGGVILLIGFPVDSVLVFEILILTAAIFHHSNLRLPGGLERWLSLLIITPSIHWVHHHAWRPDTDSNYGTMFSFWDRIFSTSSPSKRAMDLEIGVENEAEKGLLRLVLRPFLPRRTDGE
ncbi:MAG: sterol desaturase family protein [Rhodospirillaceae bacterium]|jgi:sterol desaturase/sphingolipid hydroxylase (fatty acid hydroxylase superfamily)|nr:sterol desaturase family protein [Rhodospirillaceae bacterium]MBT5751711.1 sterol desaturase family protein [Rhodospirillaceae bacterium]